MMGVSGVDRYDYLLILVFTRQFLPEVSAMNTCYSI